MGDTGIVVALKGYDEWSAQADYDCWVEMDGGGRYAFDASELEPLTGGPPCTRGA